MRNDATIMPSPVVHEALRRELAHAGVDDGVAGAALLPRVERVGVVVPVVAARPVVGPRGVGTGREDLLVEVAPAELADERARRPATAGGRCTTSSGETQPKCRYGDSRDVASPGRSSWRSA